MGLVGAPSALAAQLLAPLLSCMSLDLVQAAPSNGVLARTQLSNAKSSCATMASGQGGANYNRSSFGSQSQPGSASAPYPTHIPASTPPLTMPMNMSMSMPMSVGMPSHSEAISHPPPLSAQPHARHQDQTVHSGGSGHVLPPTNLPEHLSPQSTGLPRSLALQPPPQHLTHHVGSATTAHALSQPQHVQSTHSLQQPVHSHRQQTSHQYPSLNSIPGLHSMSQPGNMLHGLSGLQPGLQSGLQSFPWSGMGTIDGYASMPGMHSLMHHPRIETISHHQAPHHTSTTIPALGSSLSAALGSSPPFPHSSMLNGSISKPRKHRRRSDLSASIKGEDHHAFMMGLPSAKYDPSVLLPTQTPAQNLPEADGVQFKLLHQLPEAKVRRLRDEKIKPIESLTFEDIKAYNRNQLRAYCFVYGIKRKKKADMEKNMARYAAMFHPGDPNYDIIKFEPTKYIDGAIPRRKVPVTKEQKERAAGNAQELTKAIQRRPQLSPYAHDGYHSAASHHLSFPTATAQPPPLPSHSLAHTARLYDQYAVAAHHHQPQSHLSAATVGQSNPEEIGVEPTGDVMGVHDTLHVPSHLLGLSNQMVDE